MPSGRCRHCGCTEIDRDPSRGDAVCMQCGSILEESIIVSEVQYSQDCSGATRAIGQLVSAEGGITGALNLSHSFGLGKQSHEITVQNAKRKISQLAVQLKLPERCVDIALNFYKIALTKKLTQGRKNTHVVAACVYMVCRKEETAHMLLDLSDILQINVYELGKTYLKLSTALCIHTPAIDPSLYILRFAHQLEFGAKTHEVSVTASRLIQRMKRDWMHTGRRPSGLCGAALLVAARLHNFNRTVDEVIKVVKVCQATVRKRLTEFSDTPSSRLTLDEFMTIDLEEEQDPPAFKAARKKKSLELEDDGRVQEVTQEISQLQSFIDKALDEAREKKFARYAKYTKKADMSSDGSATEEFLVNNTIYAINEVLEKDGQIESAINGTGELQQLLSIPPPNGTCQDFDCAPLNIEMLQSADATMFQPTDDEMFQPTDVQVLPSTDVEILPSTDVEMLPSTDVDNCSEAQEKVEGDDDFQLDLTGLDDGEIDSYILDDEETKSKSECWFKSNEDYLKEQKEKEERRQKEEADNANKEQKKKRKRVHRRHIQANTTEEAIEKMCQQKKISLKLDYSVLQNLNSETTQIDAIKESTSPEKDESDRRPLKRLRAPVKSKLPSRPLPSSIRRGISDIIVQNRKNEPSKIADANQISENVPSELEAIEAGELGTSVHGEERISAPESELCEVTGDEELEGEEGDYEDAHNYNKHLSVAELLGQHRGEEDNDEICEYGYEYEEYDD